MNPELFMVFVPALAWLLFALGGSKISETTPGWKGWRRFILPAVFIVACYIGGVVWWKSALVGVIAMVAFHLGYGEKHSWGGRVLVGGAYALISVPIGVSYWNLITPIGFVGLFVLSNTKATAGTFVWKICEGTFGALCGIQLAYLLAGNGWVW